MSEDELEYEIARIRQDVLRFKYEILIPFLLAKYQEKGFNSNQPRIPAGDPSGNGGQWFGENVVQNRGGRSNNSPYKPPPKPPDPPSPSPPQPRTGLARNPESDSGDFRQRGDGVYINKKDDSAWSRDTSSHGGKQ